MQRSHENLNKLKVKNFPQTFSSDDKKNFMTYFGAVDVVVERDFVIAGFINENEAIGFLRTFHQKEILDRRLKVAYFTKNMETKSEVILSETPTVRTCNNINDYVLKWFSMNKDLNFNQPPPPYLSYKYPKPTREIIDSICVALESVPKFYTQVLHLMNKMNLPPPFTTAEVQKSKLEKSFESVSCQTEISNVRGKKRIWSGGEFLSDESEMESDDDKPNVRIEVPDIRIKRAKKSTIVMQNPAKRFLQKQNFPKSIRKDEPSSIFETSMSVQSRKITVHVPSELTFIENLPVENPPPILSSTQIKTDMQTTVQTISRDDFKLNRLTSDELLILPVFKNYQPGEKSNKLYIKNLSKTVTSEDLEMIFGHFTIKSKDEIQIKLMQSGRMKGQAFITFNTPYDEEDSERMIDKALQETNGFLLKDKPMVVMYGKNS